METLHVGEHENLVVALSCTEEAQELLVMFQQVAREQGWKPGGELQGYQTGSVCFVLKSGREIMGGLQLVPRIPGCALPFQRIWPELDLEERCDVAHVPILALKREYRGKGNLFWLLCVEMWRYCIEHEICRVYLEVTPNTLRRYQRIGWPLHIVAPLRSHWGEDCYLCSMQVGELASICVNRAQRSALYRRIVQQGLRLPENSQLTGTSK